VKRLPRKRLAVVVAAALLLVGVGGAVAYWSVEGSGTASAGTATTTPIVANQASAITSLDPGGPYETISGTFSNSNTSAVYVTNVVGSISQVIKATGAPSGTCDASDYTLTNATMSVGAEVPPGTGVGSWAGAQIRFNDKPGVNQDACKGATIALSYVVN
jgi:hypothetical protein